MGCLCAALLLIVTLALWPSSAHSQGAAPKPPSAPKPLQLEAKPPDEPSSPASPDVDTLPESAPPTGTLPPTTEPGAGDDVPLAANAVAHPPEIETYVVPEYPPEARAKKIQGRVLLIVVVDETGKVEDKVQVVDSIPLLDEAAIDAVHRWTFTPGRDADGDPVRVQLEVPVPFS